MKYLTIYIMLFVLLNSCTKSVYVIRESVQGYVYNKKTKKPIDSVTIHYINDIAVFLDDYKEIKFKTDANGFFKIPSNKEKTYHEYAKRDQINCSKHIKIFKEGYSNDTIYIRDTIYRKDMKKHIVYVDTIFLKPLE